MKETSKSEKSTYILATKRDSGLTLSEVSVTQALIRVLGGARGEGGGYFLVKG